MSRIGFLGVWLATMSFAFGPVAYVQAAQRHGGGGGHGMGSGRSFGGGGGQSMGHSFSGSRSFSGGHGMGSQSFSAPSRSGSSGSHGFSGSHSLGSGRSAPSFSGSNSLGSGRQSFGGSLPSMGSRSPSNHAGSHSPGGGSSTFSARHGIQGSGAARSLTPGTFGPQNSLSTRHAGGNFTNRTHQNGSNFSSRHGVNASGVGNSAMSLRNAGSSIIGRSGGNLSGNVHRASASNFLKHHGSNVANALHTQHRVSGITAGSQFNGGHFNGTHHAGYNGGNLYNQFGRYGHNGIGNYSYRGGLPYYSYRGYGTGYGHYSNLFGYGLGYGGVGYGLGYGGYGYGGYGYWGFPILRLATGIVRGAAWLIRPFYGYGYGYPRYGYGGYGYGYSSYYATNYNTYPTYAADTTVIAQSPADPTLAADAQDFAAQGEAEFQAGQYPAAARSWRHALVDDPDNMVLLLMLSQAQFATGNFDEAAGAAQYALQQLPKANRSTVVANFRELYGNVQDYTDQLRALETASEKTASPALQFLLGYHYGYLGYPKEAVRELDKGLKLMPNDGIAKELRDEFAAKLTPPASVAPAP